MRIVTFGLVLQQFAETQQRAGSDGQCQGCVVDFETARAHPRGDVAQCAWGKATVRRDQGKSVREDDLALPGAPAEQTPGESEAARKGFRGVVDGRGESVE